MNLIWNILVLSLLLIAQNADSKNLKLRCPRKRGKAANTKLQALMHQVTSMVEVVGPDVLLLKGCITDPSFKIINTGLNDAEYCQKCRFTTGGCIGANTKRLHSLYFEDLSYPGYRLIGSNGVPHHCINATNLCETFRATIVPASPHVNPKSSGRTFAPNRRGPVAFLRNGAYLVRDFTFEKTCGISKDLVNQAPLDWCQGHAWGANCMYHYHGLPTCWPKARDDRACELMGFMHDGIPIYGFCTVQNKDGRKIKMKSCYRMKPDKGGCTFDDYKYYGESACNLDKANGYYFNETVTSLDESITFHKGQYGYFFSEEFTHAPPFYVGQSQTFGTGVYGDFCGVVMDASKFQGTPEFSASPCALESPKKLSPIMG